MFDNIPAELRERPQWVVWRLEFREGMRKPTKVPYTPRPGCGMAAVTRAKDWGTFEQAINAPIKLAKDEWVDPDAKVSETGFSGIGFVFTKDDPYCGIDLDNVYGDTEEWNKQITVFNKFNSYTERSPSGTGVHIFVKGKVPVGRRRGAIELYPQGRFFTMTGDVFHNAPIREAQDELTWLFNQMGDDVTQVIKVQAAEKQTDEDEEIVSRAKNAVNGVKFLDLYEGRWQSYYQSQSEGDFALIDIIAFYTKYVPQIKRLFKQSMLGQRDKANRDDYVDYMIEKAFDRQLPPIDFDVFTKLKAGEYFEGVNAAAGAKATEPGKVEQPLEARTTAATLPLVQEGEGKAIMPQSDGKVKPFPSGLLGELAQFLYEAAPRPARDVALAGAIGLLAGITGRAYNVNGTGLNQYILLLAQTGIGKDAIASGTGKLLSEVQKSCPSVSDFRGPGELVSSAGLIKWLDRKPCCYSILGEFGKKLKEMAAPNANSHLQGVSRILLQLYSKSGHGQTLDPMAYSEKEKNTPAIPSPALTIFGESVPENFYEALDESMIADGLLPRFLVWEYTGSRTYLNENANSVVPSLSIISKINDLAAYCLSTMQRQVVHNIPFSTEAWVKFQEFDKWTTDEINQSTIDVHRQLWNRAHLKALKLAALRAVGDHYLQPQVNLEHTMWATELVVAQTRRLIAKFETGQVGQAAMTGESKQLAEVIKAFNDFMQDPDKYVKYGGRMDMHNDITILESAIQRKTAALACFRHDKMGHKYAMKRALQTLLEADDIREVPAIQMMAKYGTKPRAFVISNPKRFLDDLHSK
jgi:hypothetical protein